MACQLTWGKCCKFINLLLQTPVGVQSFAISMPVRMYVCMYVWLGTHYLWSRSCRQVVDTGVILDTCVDEPCSRAPVRTTHEHGPISTDVQNDIGVDWPCADPMSVQSRISKTTCPNFIKFSTPCSRKNTHFGFAVYLSSKPIQITFATVVALKLQIRDTYHIK